MPTKRELFGTDGVRGVANVYPMTAEMAMKLGRAAGHVFKRHRDGRHRVLIGKDTRLSGYMLEHALTAGILSMGIDALLVGPLPTPGVAYITRSLRADAGVMISASHNPYEDNGIKFFSSDGFKLPDETEEEIERLIFSGEIDNIRPTADAVGKAYRVDDNNGRYIEFVKATFPKGMTLDGMKIVVDCANGSDYKITPAVLRELGAEVVTLAVSPDGKNINANCGSQYPSRMREVVVKVGADLGAAFDGDGDRLITADHEGNLCDGDVQMAICALDMKKKGKLAKNTLVTTDMSNHGLDMALQRAGVKVVKTQVGDRYVVEKMREESLNIGGEKSGHIVFLDYNTTGDGMISLLQLLAIMRESGATLAELAGCIRLLPQVMVNVRVAQKKDLSEVPALREKITQVEERLAGQGKIVVRYSGTEPLIRVMVQGQDESEITELARQVATVAEDQLA